jgi:hypothetical protein
MTVVDETLRRLHLDLGAHKPSTVEAVRTIETKTGTHVGSDLREVLDKLGGARGIATITAAGADFEICEFWAADKIANRLDEGSPAMIPFAEDLGGNWFALTVKPDGSRAVVYVDWDTNQITDLEIGLIQFLEDLRT